MLIQRHGSPNLDLSTDYSQKTNHSKKQGSTKVFSNKGDFPEDIVFNILCFTEKKDIYFNTSKINRNWRKVSHYEVFSSTLILIDQFINIILQYSNIPKEFKKENGSFPEVTKNHLLQRTEEAVLVGRFEKGEILLEVLDIKFREDREKLKKTFPKVDLKRLNFFGEPLRRNQFLVQKVKDRILVPSGTPKRTTTVALEMHYFDIICLKVSSLSKEQMDFIYSLQTIMFEKALRNIK